MTMIKTINKPGHAVYFDDYKKYETFFTLYAFVTLITGKFGHFYFSVIGII